MSDTDGDGGPNYCDADFDNDGQVIVGDGAAWNFDFTNGLGVDSYTPDTDPVGGTDMDCNGTVNALDKELFMPYFLLGYSGC